MNMNRTPTTGDSGSPRFKDSLLVSCPGEGGLIFVGPAGCRTLSEQPATGLYWSDPLLLSGCQDDGGRELWVVKEGTPKKLQLSEDAMDIHDVYVHEDRIYIAATEQNSVICFTMDLEKVESWDLPGEHDSSHLNSVVFYEGRILASVFGRFHTNRQYKEGTAGLGQVIDVRSGETYLDGLSQPHSLTVDGDLLYLCSSEDKQLRVYKGKTLIDTVDLPGYARGIGVSDSTLYIGISRSRNIADSAHSMSTGAIVPVDKKTMQPSQLYSIDLPEIYDIRVVPKQNQLFMLTAEILNETITELKAARTELKAARGEKDYLAINTNKLEEEIDATKIALSANQAQLHEMMNSRSWQLTKPLRSLRGIIKSWTGKGHLD